MKPEYLIIAVFIILLAGCREAELSNGDVYTELKNIPQKQWDALVGKKIYFGHQSVGFDIIDGIKEIMQDLPNIKLNIKEKTPQSAFDTPVFMHSTIGTNKDPYSKIDDFKRIIESEAGELVDIAFFKFCYVDIVKGTDIDALFNYYCATLAYLNAKYPKVKFLHLTVPLRAAPRGFIVTIKRALGYALEDDEDNIKRNLFNQMLINRFRRDNLLFDLADYQATYKNGRKAFFTKNNTKYLVLAPEYSKDGGHLNAVGKKIIAKQLLIFLAFLNIER